MLFGQHITVPASEWANYLSVISVFQLLSSTLIALPFSSMQTLLLPVGRAGLYPVVVTVEPSTPDFHRRSGRPISVGHVNNLRLSSSSSLFSVKTLNSSSSSSWFPSPPYGAPESRKIWLSFANLRASSSPTPVTSPNDESEKAKLAQVLLFIILLDLYSCFACLN